MKMSRIEEYTTRILNAALTRRGDDRGPRKFNRVYEIVREIANEAWKEGIDEANKHIINSIFKG
jgi:hypothetical protein